ncbi:MAG: GNAT family N-acetyltransferase, partial [Spirochaetales bacterium]|nr:GNAT family N-acetyltransferase [Spirochaetales bacterium]
MLKNIETERLLLRKWKLSDYKDMFEYAKSDLVGPNAGWTPHKNTDESKDIIKSFIESNEVLAIELKSENKVIGGIGLHDRKPDNSIETLKQKEIGYVLNP